MIENVVAGLSRPPASTGPFLARCIDLVPQNLARFRFYFLEREVTDKNETVSLTIIKSCEYFGLFSLFSQAPRSATATAMKDSVVLQIKREAFVTFARQNPDLLIELNHVLSKRLVEAYDKIAEMTRSRSKPRELRKLYEKLDF